MISKYLRPTVPFNSLPGDLQNAIILRGLTYILIGPFIAAIGISSHSLLFGGMALLIALFFLLFLFFPYFLATRDLIVQISGKCIRKADQSHLMKSMHFYYLHVLWEDKEITVCVNKRIYRRIRTELPLNIYVLPKNILPKGNGYLINDPVFILQTEGFIMQPTESDNQDLKK